MPAPPAGAGKFNESVRSDHRLLHSAAAAAATAAGRPLAPSLVVGSSVLPVRSFNAVSIPNGRCVLQLQPCGVRPCGAHCALSLPPPMPSCRSIYLHAGLIEGVSGSRAAVRFVAAHEVGHALARHSSAALVRTLMQPLAISAAVGAASVAAVAIREAWVSARLDRLCRCMGNVPGHRAARKPAACPAWPQVSRGRRQDDEARRRRPWALRWLPPDREHERRAECDTEGLVEDVNLGSQLGLNVLALLGSQAASRRHEHEADLLALCLMRAAGGACALRLCSVHRPPPAWCHPS